MAIIYPDLENIQRLKVPPTAGEWHLINYLKENLDDTYEIFFNPFLDGDRPDIIILKEHCAAFIIEVKDWDLSNFRVTEKNKWEFLDGTKSSKKASPHSQVFRYKKNLYDLHLPIIGLAMLTNKNFFNLVHCFVYFHNSDQDTINNLYAPAERNNKDEESNLNQRRKDGKLSTNDYEKCYQYLDRKRNALQRDKIISVGIDKLELLIKKIKKNSNIHVLFRDDVYRDFKRRLTPSEHTLKQGIAINFDKKQLLLTKSKETKEKIKGVAGCGKSTILAQRAINAYERHKTPVLILTFNITLKNYIRDKISDIQGCREFSNFEITNYHQFFNAQINNTEQDISELVNKYGLEGMYSVNVFDVKNTIKYKTILIDEIQDYRDDWVKIVKNNFLESNGEMVLFGDESQNIYQRGISTLSVAAEGFGHWLKLSKSYRTNINSPLNQIFKDFQLEFLIGKYADTELFDTSPTQITMGFSILKYEQIPLINWKQDIFDSIKYHITEYDLHPNDVVVLCSKINSIRDLNDFWLEREKTHCMFETYEELSVCTNIGLAKLKEFNDEQINDLIKKNKDIVEKVRRTKKNHFYANSGLIKLSTIHSYKGLESKTVFFVMHEQDEPELVYTSITRSSENLVIFDLGNKNLCSNFFKKNIA